MADIFMDFPIKAIPARVFEGISTPKGLNAWWTSRCTGEPVQGAEYVLWFGPKHDWRAEVRRCIPDQEFELQITRADGDWLHTRVGFILDGSAKRTQVRFYHAGWPQPNEHWRVSCYCWAMYLRILRRNLEHGERVPYARRLDV
jgi:uncharacterized protein YndB with AHSA1/START domain